MIEVNSLISTGLSSNSVFLLATVHCQHSIDLTVVSESRTLRQFL
jgi:hypothetical protein